MLEYFDIHAIGLTAALLKRTFCFFDQNLVIGYTYEQAIADGVNVGYDVFCTRTRITEMGEQAEAGYILTRDASEPVNSSERDLVAVLTIQIVT